MRFDVGEKSPISPTTPDRVANSHSWCNRPDTSAILFYRIRAQTLKCLAYVKRRIISARFQTSWPRPWCRKIPI